MANELVGACWLVEFPTPAMRLVMMKICDCADPDGTNIYPSVPTICEETNLSPSTVRLALAAFEQSGLLDVVGHKFGNRQGKTTVVRELDTDLFRLITGQRVKGKPKKKSTHILSQVETTVPPGADSILHPDAATISLIEKPPTELTAMKVWAIVKRPAELGDTPTPPTIGGVENGTPPTIGGATTDRPSDDRTSPLRSSEGTPPTIGPNPSLNPSLDPSPPTPEGARGRRKRFDEVEAIFRELITEAPGDEARRFAIDEVLKPIVTQRHFDAPSLTSAIRSRVEWIARQGLSSIEARILVEKVLADRRSTVKPADIDDAVKAAIACRPPKRILAGDPELMTRWPDVVAALEKFVGPERAATVSTFVIDRLARTQAGRVIAHVSTHVPGAKHAVELSLSAPFRAALSAAFPDVTDVFIETRRIAA